MKAMPTIPRPTTKILVRVRGGFERVVWVVAVVEDESEGEDGRDEVDPEAEAEDEDVVAGIGAVMMGEYQRFLELDVVFVSARIGRGSRCQSDVSSFAKLLTETEMKTRRTRCEL